MIRGSVAVGHPVDVARGTVFSTHTDLSIPGKIALTWNRRYSTALLSLPPSPLGPGWTTRYFATLTHQEGAYHFIAPEGECEIFNDPRHDVDRGAVVRNFGTFQEIARHGSRYVITRWNIDNGEIERYIFVRGKQGEPWPLAAIEDVTGRGLDMLYDGRGRLSGVRQRLEKRTLIFEYTRGDRIKSVAFQSSENRKKVLAHYEYDAHGRLMAAYDALDNKDTYEYDEHSRMTGEFVKDGGAFFFIYDEKGRCLKTAGLDGYDEKTFRYLDAQGWTEVTDSVGYVRRYQYNGAGQVIAEVDPLGGEKRTEYDEFGRVVATIDALGAATRYAYDDEGNRCTMIDAAGGEATATYNHHHRFTSVTDPGGGEWKREFDQSQRPVTATDPLGGRWRFAWDKDGNLVGLTDPRGVSLRRVFSSDGILLEETDWEGNLTRYVRDEFGRVIERTDPLGETTIYRYDDLGNLVEITYADGSRRSAEYDTVGNVIVLVDRNGRKTTYQYGTCRRLVSKTDALGAVMKCRWGSEPNRPEYIINETGEIYRFSHNEAGQLIGEEGFDGRKLAFEYDAAGRCVARTNGLDERIAYTRDPRGKVIEEKLPDGSTTAFTYDAVGNLISAVNADCVVSIERDLLGRPIKEQQGEYVLEYGYDATGNQISLKTNAGYDVSFDVDGNGQVSKLSAGDYPSFTFERNGRGQESTRMLSDGLNLDHEYDALGRLVGQYLRRESDTSPGDVLISREYEYDRADNLVGMRDGERGQTTYIYDPVERLTRVIREQGGGELFVYDRAGNLTNISGQDADAETLEYAPGNRLVRRGHTSYAYDNNGRLIRKSEKDRPAEEPREWEYVWDANDRLRSVRTPTGELWIYAYDALGRRVRKQGPGKTVTFIWNGNQIIQQLDNTSPTSMWVFDRHSFRPLCQIQAGHVYSIITDHLSTPRELVDQDGRIVWSADYKAWGEIRETTVNEISCPIRFQGQWYDDESGLHYSRFRYYDPHNGRFISPDPIRLLGGPNLYRYARNPINWVDPLGLNGGGCDDEDIKDLKKELEDGADPTRIVPDDYVVVRGGQGDMPTPGTTFSGAVGTTAEGAGMGVPHGSIRQTTAGEIRAAGGTVEYAPEPTRSGTTNYRHVNVTEGGSESSFPANHETNPAPKSDRYQ